ncbi:MAG TPA: lipoyl(octanoyl) transferase LipB [Solirubrobacteraceae bacterium]|jgi:lipoyl(octanoyl) transferase|nr:lipoyl(octanoyl) transferase LipB [Solirubrobacteraceae bacterium]
MHELWVANLGVVPYREADALQQRLREARKADEVPDTLLLLEHPPVYTRGRRTNDEELPLGGDFYAAQGINVVEVDRGGRATYHGPGQLVGYPIMRIGDIIGYLRTIEGAIIAALALHGVAGRGGGERPTGVWAGKRKIASIGVHVSRRVTTHGFAVNVDGDLEPFEWIVPCGLSDVTMTSLQREGGRDIGGFRASVAEQFALAFERCATAVSAEAVAAAAPERAGIAAAAG